MNNINSNNQFHRREFLLGSLGLAGAALIPGCSRESKNMAAIQNSPNYANGKFKNPVPTVVMKEGTTWDTMKQWFTDTDTREPSNGFDFSTKSFTANHVSYNGLQIMWVGHSTLLVEIDGKHFLTDPGTSRWRHYLKLPVKNRSVCHCRHRAELSVPLNSPQTLIGGGLTQKHKIFQRPS